MTGASMGGPSLNDPAANSPSSSRLGASELGASGVARSGHRGAAFGVAVPAVAAAAGRAVLRAEDLAVGYGGEIVVRGISLILPPGHSLAIIGTNGSGKTTLLKTIVGLRAPLSGRLEVLGRAPGRSPQGIAYLGQFHVAGIVLPVRAVDVVRMGRYPNRGLLGRLTSEDHDLVRSAMQAMGVERQADQPLRSLSGGQQQRVYLAQVLARRAELLVLDEPTAGLDAAGRELFELAMAAEVARGASIVTATHDIQDAAECDQVLALARRVVAVGVAREVLSPDTLMETFGIAVRGHLHGVTAVGHEQPFDRAGRPRT
jgi:ABC-type Mn2+/Zn2+ transport system ATPase subunit